MISLKKIINFLGDIVLDIAGNKNVSVVNPTPLGDYNDNKNCISFCESLKHKNLINKSKSVVIVVGNFFYKKNYNIDKTFVIVDEPRITYIKILNKFFYSPTKKSNLKPQKISKKASISNSAVIFPGAIIGDAIIGDNSVIHSNVTIYDNVKIGDNNIIHSGAVIGCDGYHFHRSKLNEIYKFPSLAGVKTGNNVEIGSNSVIDKGTLSNTIIGNDVKIDNFVHVGHSCIIGDKIFISASTVLGGNSLIGKNVWFGLNSTISNNIKIGNNSVIRLGSVVIKDIKDYGINQKLCFNHKKI